MIAVSSNTHKILVFTFALDLTGSIDEMCKVYFTKESSCLYRFGGPFISLDPPFYLRSRSDHRRPQSIPKIMDQRELDIVIGLVGHDANVPNIAFWNPESQSDQIYLASTDIAGRTLIWEVWTGKKVLDMAPPRLYPGKFHAVASDEFSLIFQGARGWNVACLDPRFFCQSIDLQDTYGTENVTMSPQNCISETSHCAHSIEDNSRFHPAFTRFSIVPVDHGQDPSTAVIPGIANIPANGDSYMVNSDSETGDEEIEEEDEEQDEDEEAESDVDVAENPHVLAQEIVESAIPRIITVPETVQC